MKYVLKEAGNHPDDKNYIDVPKNFALGPSMGFNYTSRLDEATLFNSISDAVNTVVTRQIHSVSNTTPKRFTIAGVEEVISTVRKEVVL